MANETATSDNGILASFFSQPDESRPLGLEVEEQVFWVPKDGLCLYSPVFKNMLYGQFAEANRVKVKLPGKRVGDVDELLLCLFPNPVVKKVDDSNVDLLLDFADEYEIADLTSRCTDFLHKKLDQLRNGDERLIDVLVLASKHRLREILFQVVERCAECFELEKFEPVFDRLSSEVIGALAWYKCQRVAAAADRLQQQQQIANMCNNCRNGHTQNRCTSCGGARKCPICSALPKRLRTCACGTNRSGNMIRGASVAVMSEALENEDDKSDQCGIGNKNFDGAALLLKRL